MNLETAMARLEKACKFMDGPATIEEKERWQPELYKVLDEINAMTAGMSEPELNRLANGI